MIKSETLIINAIDKIGPINSEGTAAERLQILLESDLWNGDSISMDVFKSALEEMQTPVAVCRIGSEDAIIYSDLSITPLIGNDEIIGSAAFINEASGIRAYGLPTGVKLPFSVTNTDFMFLVMSGVDQIFYASAGLKALQNKVQTAHWAFETNAEANTKRRETRDHLIELIKDFRTPVIEDEGDLEDRQDWSDADVQKLDSLLKTLMIALNPSEEPWQSIEIVSGTDWDTAEVELEVDDEVLKSAVETLADLEKFIGYEYVMSRQDGYRMEDWEQKPLKVTIIEVDLDEIPHSEINAAKLELKSLIDNNSQLSETLKSKIESRLS
jgi:hypothetical protein